MVEDSDSKCIIPFSFPFCLTKRLLHRPHVIIVPFNFSGNVWTINGDRKTGWWPETEESLSDFAHIPRSFIFFPLAWTGSGSWAGNTSWAGWDGYSREETVMAARLSMEIAEVGSCSTQQ